ncbi:hypothetical protein [Pseudobdellovibrio sp. HCB154]|uniref:hypothetical protein n=1 Tax=Pseudobdellovibrio sp. HCB154 TaxID=3386277 RepID=UPI0039170362
METEKVDLNAYFSESDIPWDFLKDPSNWMYAPDMEAFLERIITKQEQIERAGHLTPKLRVWGVLDSVLRMMPRPQEIFHQPEKFLGYFISPEPPIENVIRTDAGISFDIPLPAEQYPLVTTYLKAAFEALPIYVGLTPGQCRWTQVHFELDWPGYQDTILDEQEHHQVSPQLMQEVINQLQISSRDLEEKNRELQRRNEELQRLAEQKWTSKDKLEAVQLSPNDFAQFEFIRKPTHQVAQNLARLHDYMVRAHQLVTLLTAGQKATPAMKAMFHKVDWDLVKSQYPQIIFESIEILKKMNKPDEETSLEKD